MIIMTLALDLFVISFSTVYVSMLIASGGSIAEIAALSFITLFLILLFVKESKLVYDEYKGKITFLLFV